MEYVETIRRVISHLQDASLAQLRGPSTPTGEGSETTSLEELVAMLKGIYPEVALSPETPPVKRGSLRFKLTSSHTWTEK